MSNNELLTAIEKYNEWREMKELSEKQMKEYEAKIKSFMEENCMEEYPCGRYIVRFTDVLSNRFDTTGFKKENPDIYNLYIRKVASRRFTISE